MNSEKSRELSNPGISNFIEYLEVDINMSEKRFRKYMIDYNNKLKDLDFLQQQYQIHRSYKVQVKPTVKSLSIKNQQLLTVSSIIKSFYYHLVRLKKDRISQPGPFVFTQHDIASMADLDEGTARRHFNKLLATGFLMELDKYGKKAPLKIKINPEFLVARPNSKLSEILINHHRERYPGIPINSLTLDQYNALRPSFKDFPSGVIFATCPHVEINPDTYNNNILSKGIVDNSLNTKSKRPLKLSVINNDSKNSSFVGNPDNKNPEQTNVRLWEDTNQSYQENIKRESKENITQNTLFVIFSYTDLAWNFAKSLLYENKNFRPDQEQRAKKHIAGFFLEYVKNNISRSLSPRYTDFTTTIQIIYEYINRKVEWQLADPEYFFDPHFKGGFYRAYNDWLPKHQHRQQINKAWNSNKELVANLYRYYSIDPSLERYNRCIQRLKKLKNKKFLDIFNTCVVEKERFNTEIMNQQF